MPLVPCPAAVNARQYPQRAAVSWAGRSVVWEALNNYIHSTSRYLKEIAVRPNARILLLREDSPSYIIVLLALWRIGAAVCPVPVQASSEYIEQIRAIVKPEGVIGPRKIRKVWGAGGRWVDIEQVVAYGYNDSFLGSETALDPKIDTDHQALLRIEEDQGGLRVQVLTHAGLKDDPKDMASFFYSLDTGEALIF